MNVVQRNTPAIYSHFDELRDHIVSLSSIASQHPYYKHNEMWSRALQNAAFATLFLHWLGWNVVEKQVEREASSPGRLLSLEDLGTVFGG